MKKFLFALLLFLATIPSLVRAADNETAFDRILRTGTIRCGYGLWPPALIKDANSGAMSGLFYEQFNALAELLSLKVEWNFETNYGQALTDLDAGKFDILCSGIWQNAVRGKFAEFTDPLYYQGQALVVRVDDHRFDRDRNLLNSAEVRMAVLDGEMGDIIRQQSFSKAVPIGLVMGDNTQLMMMVAQKKADFTASEAAFVEGYLKTNPGQLRVLGTPIRTFPVTYPVAKGDYRLQQMLNSAIMEFRTSGRLDALLDAHPEISGIYRLPPLYAMPQ